MSIDRGLIDSRILLIESITFIKSEIKIKKQNIIDSKRQWRESKLPLLHIKEDC